MNGTGYETNRLSNVLVVAPLAPVTAGVITGVVIDHYASLPAAVYVLGLLCLTAAAIWARRWQGVAPMIAVGAGLCVGALAHAADVRSRKPESIERYVQPQRRLVRLRGAVTTAPRLIEPADFEFARWSYGRQRTAFLLDIAAIQTHDGWRPCTGRVRVSVREPVLDLRRGEPVELLGWLLGLPPLENPGGFDWAGFQRRQGVVAGVYCNHREAVRRRSDRPPAPGLVDRIRAGARRLLIDDAATGQPGSGLLDAMILGHRTKVAERVDEAFVRAGCVHFLAVSGFHVGVLLTFVWFVGRRMWLSRRVCAVVMLGAALLYLTIAEPRPPILRATMIAGLWCVAILLGRPRAGLNWLAVAALMLVLIQPLSVFDPGFQLSFVAVIGIMVLPRGLRELGAVGRRQFERTWLGYAFGDEDRALRAMAVRRRGGFPALWQQTWRTVGNWVLAGFLVSLAAWLACMPIVAAHFGRIHAWSPLNAMLVLPLVYLLIILSFAKLLLNVVAPGLGEVFTAAIAKLDVLLTAWVGRLADLPGAAFDVAVVPWWWIVSWYLALSVIVWRFRSPVAIEDLPEVAADLVQPPRGATWGCGVSVSLLCLATAVWLGWRPGAGRMTLAVLSVGAGSAMVLELPDGTTMLWDAGTAQPYDVGRRVVVPYLRHRGIDRLDAIYISHPNLDHFSGLPGVVEAVEAGPVIVNQDFMPQVPDRAPARHLLRWLEARDHPVRVMDPDVRNWRIGGATFEWLWPAGDYDDTLTSNDTSTVLKVTYLGHSILLTGDIEDRAQYALIHRGNLESDVLVLPHHGSVGRALPDFLDAVNASVLIRSSHESTAETITGLPDIAGDTPLLNTADDGAVMVTIDRAGLRVTSTASDRAYPLPAHRESLPPASADVRRD